jgi:hypothetical protein
MRISDGLENRLLFTVYRGTASPVNACAVAPTTVSLDLQEEIGWKAPQ